MGKASYRQAKADKAQVVPQMKFEYDQPAVIATPKPVAIEKIRHGVTEVSLSDGRLVRLTVHVQGLNPVHGTVDIACSIVTEVVVAPSAPIMDQHETHQ